MSGSRLKYLVWVFFVIEWKNEAYASRAASLTCMAVSRRIARKNMSTDPDVLVSEPF